MVPNSAKYPLPQMWQILRKQFLKASDGFTDYIIERRFFICGRRGQHSINLDSRNCKKFSLENL